MTDNLMVTRIDQVGLSFAAVVQSNSITNLVIAFLTGLSSGAVVLVSQYWGKKDTKSIMNVGAVALSLSLGVAVITAIVINIFSDQVLQIVIHKKETGAIQLAKQYLPLVSLSYLPYAVTACLVGMLRGVEIVRVTVYTTFSSLLANIILNYVLIFGKFGFPALGVQGAALATVLARLIEMILVILFVWKKQVIINLHPSFLFNHKAWAWQDYSKYGLPVGLTDAQWAIIGMLKMVIIGQLGIVMSNAVGVTDSLMNLGTLFTFSMAGGAAVMVGKAVGEGDLKLARAYSSTIQIMFLGIGMIMAVIVFFIRAPFISLYSLTPEATKLANQMVSLCAITLVGTSYHASCFVGINRGAGDNRFVMMVDMICGWLIVLPSAAIAAFFLKFPLAWVYFFTRIDQTFKWIIAFLRLRGSRWIHHVTRNAASGANDP